MGRTTMLFTLACMAIIAVAGDGMTGKKLTPEEERVIVHKGTEAPFTGAYYNFHGLGTYTCKRCGAALYRSQDKFDSGCGWPSFDDEIPGAVKRVPDPDGMRTEIECAHCGSHLGHVFLGEGLTAKNTRHCVNSISMNFVPAAAPNATPNAAVQAVPAAQAVQPKTETAIFAGGCFWGTQFYFQKAPGVLSTQVGYIGGHTENPTYRQVCNHDTGHAEAVQVTFDPSATSFEALATLFFNIHDPTQVDRQGPDVGDQYRSAIFYTSEAQRQTAEKLIGMLKAKGYNVATQVVPATPFWPAEDYHQNYYEKKHGQPYCHIFRQRL